MGTVFIDEMLAGSDLNNINEEAKIELEGQDKGAGENDDEEDEPFDLTVLTEEQKKEYAQRKKRLLSEYRVKL